MSPVSQSNNHAGRAAIVALVAVVALFAILGFVSVALGDRTGPELRGLGDDTFKSQRADRLAKEIAENGPVLYSDVSGRRERDIIVNHVGKDNSKGWYAFLAAPPNKARDCTWQWKPSEKLFRAACDKTLTAPADGQGLERFRITVSDNRIDVDLKTVSKNPDESTTSTPQPTATSNAD